jgi:RNA polymerase sigma-70 factor (ECF subfamily)
VRGELSVTMLLARMPAEVGRDTERPALPFEAAALRPVVRAVVAATLGAPLSHPDVEDATHEALRRALEGHDRLRPGELLRPWLLGIARHVALDVLRARKRAAARLAPVPPPEESSRDLAERVPDSKPGPLDRVVSAHTASAVHAALSKLPDGSRRALELFHLEGKSYPEIAKELDVPIGTVATWILRGRKALAAALGKEEVRR